ncbi:hypothetical protein GOBAR_AA21196 [Gossypium barbadense]|uniref:t-SNARE coiled-coil homology domain-containing protein n=1 Tax=Gossypium barbadense TaxID=3634 RepID=A0A2P5X807_GOSBA|nr:hypothetical protein GOBAR_AA21196 [Gossypium barbadense]
MSYRRDHRSSKSALFDGLDNLEEGGLRASSSFSHDVKEHDNGKAIESLHDRVAFLKRVFAFRTCNELLTVNMHWLTGDIHDEVESHNCMLDRMGNGMDATRGIMSGTMDRFKKVFEKKSNRKMCTLVMAFVVSFLIIYYLFRGAVISFALSA